MVTNKSIDEIKKEYPDQWVLLKIEEKDFPTCGEVILSSKDYLELCYKGSELPKNILTSILFTGESPKRRKWLKFSHLKENQKTI
jgi:hypothetical protein